MVSGSLRCAISLQCAFVVHIVALCVRSLHVCECACPPGSDRSGRLRSSHSLTRWLVSAPAQVSGWSCNGDHITTSMCSWSLHGSSICCCVSRAWSVGTVSKRLSSKRSSAIFISDMRHSTCACTNLSASDAVLRWSARGACCCLSCTLQPRNDRGPRVVSRSGHSFQRPSGACMHGSCAT